jgi:hypothetical protein
MNDTNVQLIKGSGTVLRYGNKDPVTGYYEPQDRDRNALQRAADGTWIETQPDEFKLYYRLPSSSSSSKSSSSSLGKSSSSQSSASSSSSSSPSKSSSSSLSKSSSSQSSSSRSSASKISSSSSSLGKSSSSQSSVSQSSVSQSSASKTSSSLSQVSSSVSPASSSSRSSTSGRKACCDADALPPNPPYIIFATFENISGCSCLGGLVVQLTRGGPAYHWDGGIVPTQCNSNQALRMWIDCDGSPGCDGFKLWGCCGNAPFCTTFAPVIPPDSCTCSPFELVYDNLSVSGPCCTGTVRIRVTS